MKHRLQLPRPSEKAFTLVELTVVLLIVSLALALIVPRVVVGSRQMQERGFVISFQSLLEKARAKAMVSGRPTSVWIDSERRKITFGSYELSVPEEVDIYGENLSKSERGYYLKFFPDGSSSGRKLQIIFGESRNVFIVFNPLTGSIHWYEESGG